SPASREIPEHRWSALPSTRLGSRAVRRASGTTRSPHAPEHRFGVDPAGSKNMNVTESRVVQRVRRWPRRVVITLAVIIVVLVAARIAAPFVIKQQVNARLANIPGYRGHVDSIGLGLLRGAYTLNGLAIYRQDGDVREPFFLARQIDFSVAWRELLHRKIVSDITVDRGEINFVKAATEEESQKKIDRRWNDVVKDLFPIDITHVEWTDGALRYEDKTKQPFVDVYLKHMHLVADGLQNRPAETGAEFPAEIRVNGDSLGGGHVRLVLVAEPLAAQPHFHLSFKIDDVNLPALNESMKAIAGVDVGRGKFQMVAEMAGKDGGFQGYVKPFFTDLNFHNSEDKEKGI